MVCRSTPIIETLSSKWWNFRGREGDELEDYAYNLTKPRRRSNSFSTAAGHKDFKTKFETVEPEPVFEEEMMDRSAADNTVDSTDDTELDKQSTNSSSGGGSVEEEDSATAKKAWTLGIITSWRWFSVCFRKRRTIFVDHDV